MCMVACVQAYVHGFMSIRSSRDTLFWEPLRPRCYCHCLLRLFCSDRQSWSHAVWGSWLTLHMVLMAVLQCFEVPFKDDLFYDFIVIILTVVWVWGCICAGTPRLCVHVDLFLCTCMCAGMHMQRHVYVYVNIFVCQLWNLSSELRCISFSLV